MEEQIKALCARLWQANQTCGTCNTTNDPYLNAISSVLDETAIELAGMINLTYEDFDHEVCTRALLPKEDQ